GERLVERDVRVPEAGDAALVPEGDLERLTQADRDVLDGVVRVDVRVAGRLDGEVDQGVLAQGGEHVVVEGHGRGDVRAPGSVEVDLDEHRRLGGRPLDTRRPAAAGHSPATSTRASLNAT